LEARELTQSLTHVGEAYLLSPPGPLRMWTEWADADEAPADWPYREQLARWIPAPPRTLDLGRRVRLALLARAEQGMARSREGAPSGPPPRAAIPTMPPPTAGEAGTRPVRRRGRKATPEPGPILSFLDPAGADVAPAATRARRAATGTAPHESPAPAVVPREQEGPQPHP